ncbi:MAG: MXAN_5187 family protein, partial [Polyangiaceae bacterium]
MVFSRAWYIILSVSLAAAVFMLYLATAVSNRNAEHASGKLLTATSRSVYWYLTDDARRRASALIELSVDSDIQAGLSKANGADSLKKVDQGLRDKVAQKLAAFRSKHDQAGGLRFHALWAVDRQGRVVASENYADGTDSEHFEMGGYPIVADAIHGWIRDDTWVLNDQINRIVAHPVETVVGGEPVGAIVASSRIDARFAQRISDSTGAAVAFYAGGTTKDTGAPKGFSKSLLEVTSKDLAEVEADVDYQKKGRTTPRVLRRNVGTDVGVVFARMPGEAWDQGAGYVVGHRHARLSDPLEFRKLATDSDNKSVPLIFIILAAVGAALLGLFFSLVEHTLPLRGFRGAIKELADKHSKVDVLKPTTFRGAYKRLAANVNDALDKAASAAGIERGPADLESVLGPLPAKPQMSAFAVPESGLGPRDKPSKKAELPTTPESPNEDDDLLKTQLAGAQTADVAADVPDEGSVSSKPPVTGSPPAPPRKKAPLSDAPADPADEETRWRQVYADFVALKKQLGESTDRLNYKKFRGTLQRNKDALIARHNCTRVKFRVYEKKGRAAL